MDNQNPLSKTSLLAGLKRPSTMIGITTAAVMLLAGVTGLAPALASVLGAA